LKIVSKLLLSGSIPGTSGFDICKATFDGYSIYVVGNNLYNGSVRGVIYSLAVPTVPTSMTITATTAIESTT